MTTTTTTNPAFTLRVAVGSGNPAKIKAVEVALRKALTLDTILLQVQGFAVDSGVSHQPFGDEETRQGAEERARRAYRAFAGKNKQPPHLAVGLEGGLDRLDKVMYCMAWMAIFGRRTGPVVQCFASPLAKSYHGDKKARFGVAKTAAFPLPPKLQELVDSGMELGHADDKLFNRTNGKQGSGTVGILTNNMIDRSHYYEHALQLALIPWIRPDVYPSI